MFSKFKVSSETIESLFPSETAVKDFRTKEESIKSHVKSFLDYTILGTGGIINGTALQDEWFPTEKEFDVFISYSHNDIDLAQKLASYLTGTGLKCFLDCYVWDSADELLAKLDEKYCKNSDGLFDYKKRNFSTSHIHAMLSMAIMSAINKSECIIFINSDNSLRLDGIKTETLSPWLYEEVSMANSLKIKTPKRYGLREIRMFSEGATIQKSFNGLSVSYDLDLNEFHVLSLDDLKKMYLLGGPLNHPLDILYRRHQKR